MEKNNQGAPREGDVFRFSYSQEHRQKVKASQFGGDLDWCFDGQLVFRDGAYRDTYWGLDWCGDSGRTLTTEQAAAQGQLTFLCNLEDVDKIHPEEFPLYAAGDAFNLTHQHGCCKHYVRRKSARKNKDLMIAAVHKRIRLAHEEIERAARKLEWASRDGQILLARIEAGEEVSL